MIGTKTHFIPPVNLRLLALGPCANLGVVLLEPLLHRFWILLKSSTHRLLRGKPPFRQIASHRPDRKTNAVSLLNQSAHRLPRPQVKGQSHLLRFPVHPAPGRLRRLPRFEAASFGPPAALRLKRFFASFTVLSHPRVYRLTRHAKYRGHFSLSPSGPPSRNRFFPNVFLRFGIQRAKIFCFHVSMINEKHVCVKYLLL